MTEQPPHETVEIKPGYSFDQQIIDLVQPVLHEVFLKHGEYVRSIGVFFDYHGPFNGVDINKGIWIGPQGAVTTPAGVVGSLEACVTLLETILKRTEQLTEGFKERLTVLINEINQRSETDDSTEKEKEE